MFGDFYLGNGFLNITISPISPNRFIDLFFCAVPDVPVDAVVAPPTLASTDKEIYIAPEEQCVEAGGMGLVRA